MAGPTPLYVDPAINAGSGVGTEIDPFGDLQYGLDRQGTDYTRDAVDGNQFVLTPGTPEILTGPLDKTGYGTPTRAAPLVIIGAAGFIEGTGADEQAEIDGNGNSIWNDAAQDGIHFINLKMHNSGAGNPLLFFDRYCSMQDCELYGPALNGVFFDGFSTAAIGNFVHDTETFGISSPQYMRGNLVMNCGTTQVQPTSQCFMERNILYVENDTNARAIYLLGSTVYNIVNNTMEINGSNQRLFEFPTNIYADGSTITGNILTQTGIQHASAYGYRFPTGADKLHHFRNNYSHNLPVGQEQSPADITEVAMPGAEDTIVLTNDPFVRQGSPGWTNRRRYWAPRNISTLWATGAGAIAAVPGPIIVPSFRKVR